MKELESMINKIHNKYDMLWKKIDIEKFLNSLYVSRCFSFDLDNLQSHLMVYDAQCHADKFKIPLIIDLIPFDKMPDILLFCWEIIDIHENIKKAVHTNWYQISNKDTNLSIYGSIYYKNVDSLFNIIYDNYLEEHDEYLGKLEEYGNILRKDTVNTVDNVLKFYTSLDIDYEKIKRLIFSSLCVVIILDICHYQFLLTLLFCKAVEKNWLLLEHIPFFNKEKYCIIVESALKENRAALKFVPFDLHKIFALKK